MWRLLRPVSTAEDWGSIDRVAPGKSARPISSRSTEPPQKRASETTIGKKYIVTSHVARLARNTTQRMAECAPFLNGSIDTACSHLSLARRIEPANLSHHHLSTAPLSFSTLNNNEDNFFCQIHGIQCGIRGHAFGRLSIHLETTRQERKGTSQNSHSKRTESMAHSISLHRYCS